MDTCAQTALLVETQHHYQNTVYQVQSLTPPPADKKMLRQGAEALGMHCFIDLGPAGLGQTDRQTDNCFS